MDLGLKEKNAAVSGASQGIGYSIALALADEGCNVAISARGEERLSQAVQDIEARGVKGVGIQCDMSTAEGAGRFIDEAAGQLGGLDILVNNVGGMIPGTIDSLSDDQWTDIINRNLMAYVWATRAAIPHLKNASAGRILNVSGMTGKQLLPGALTTTLPNSSIIGFTKVMAGELGKEGITVNNICPGIVNTESWGPRAEMMAKVRSMTVEQIRQMFSDLTLLARWGEPEEIGTVAAFLVSEKNSYMTGTTVEVCGGWSRYI